MKKHIFTLMVLAVAAFGVPSVAHAVPAVQIIENDFQDIDISIIGNVLRVTGAAGQSLSIYNVTGVRVMSLRVDGSDKSYNLNLPKGCYIVKVGKVVRKISIK